MELYKSDYDSNNCEVSSKQATPPTLTREVLSVRLQEEEIVNKISKVLVKGDSRGGPGGRLPPSL